MSHIELSEFPPDQLAGEVLAVSLFEDDRPPTGPAALVDWRLGGHLSRLLLSGRLTGRRDERFVLEPTGKLPVEWLLVCGSGARTLAVPEFAGVVQQMASSCIQAGYRKIILGLPADAELPFSGAVQAVESAMRQLGCRELDCTISYYPQD